MNTWPKATTYNKFPCSIASDPGASRARAFRSEGGSCDKRIAGLNTFVKRTPSTRGLGTGRRLDEPCAHARVEGGRVRADLGPEIGKNGEG